MIGLYVSASVLRVAEKRCEAPMRSGRHATGQTYAAPAYRAKSIWPDWGRPHHQPMHADDGTDSDDDYNYAWGDRVYGDGGLFVRAAAS